MFADPIRKKIRAGQPAFGIGLLWPSPEMTELFGALGYDWLWLDLEHGAFDVQALSHTVRAADASGVVAIGRLPKTRDEAQVLRLVETGLGGVITPHVHSAEDIEWVANAIKYPPVGKRSAGLMRGAGWGAAMPSAEYYERVNEQIMILALVEDMEGIDNLDNILACEHLDGVVIGFGDLSLTLGYARKDHPDVRAVGDRAWRKVLDSGKILQVTAQTPGEAAAAVELGAHMVRCTAHQVLATATRAWIQGARAASPAKSVSAARDAGGVATSGPA